jgi:hypothetical protein
MAATSFVSPRGKHWPWLVIIAVVLITAVLLHAQGRLWVCACGRIDLWAGNTQSADNSQHLLDPYSFTHVLHGLVFYAVFAGVFPRLALAWRLALAIIVEALWEVVENSAFVIQRYREVTLALGYEGDTIVNALGDLLCCALGFLLARQLGFRRSLALFVVTELVLMLWIRDSLVLNIVGFVAPDWAVY